MSDWKPIKALTIGNIGDDIDVQEDKRLYSNVGLAGIDFLHETVIEGTWGGKSEALLGPLGHATLHTVGGDIRVSYDAKWRIHV